MEPDIATMILKMAVSHRGTETTETADKQLHLCEALRNRYLQGVDQAPESRPHFHWLCALGNSAATQLPDLGMVESLLGDDELAATRSEE